MPNKKSKEAKEKEEINELFKDIESGNGESHSHAHHEEIPKFQPNPHPSTKHGQEDKEEKEDKEPDEDDEEVKEEEE